MNIIVLTPVRLLGDGLGACMSCRPNMCVVAVVNDLTSLREALAKTEADLVLIDVSHGIDLHAIREIATAWAEMPLVALGLEEQLQDVVQCGRAGFAGYVVRDASIDALCKALEETVEGRLACPPEIASGLLRALGAKEPPSHDRDGAVALTVRESEVLELLGSGLANKEIASELCLSVATVKHHVHHVLEKLGLPGRAHAMRRVQDAPWIARTAALGRSRSAS